MSWGGCKPQNLPKPEIASVAGVADDGRATWQRVSCGDGCPALYPGLANGGDRVLWSETRGTTDVVTCATPVGTCE